CRKTWVMATPEFSRIVLLGHTGYIGRRLAAALESAAPHVPVIGRSAPTLDLTRPESAAAMGQLLDPECPLGIRAAIKKQLGDTLETFEQNLAIVLNICRALASRPVRRVVFFSSAAVYGEDVEHDVITESTPVQPTSLYGIGKFTAERLLVRVTTPQA